jgi:hypothetical protein
MSNVLVDGRQLRVGFLASKYSEPSLVKLISQYPDVRLAPPRILSGIQARRLGSP